MDAVLIGQGIVSGLLIGGIYSLIAVGLNLIFGVMGIINFAHGALMMLGMYATFWLVGLLGLNPYMTLFVTVPLLFLVGALIQRFLINPVLNAPETIQILLTLGIALWIENMALVLWSPNFRSIVSTKKLANFYLGEIMVNQPRLYGFLVAIACVILLSLFLRRTDLGLAIQAAAQNKDGAWLIGIPVQRIYVVAFGIGTACVGASGTLVMPFLYVYPEVGYMFVLTAFIVVVMGGMGNLMGAFYCGLIVGCTESLGGLFLKGSLKQAVVFSIFILVLLFRPRGLFAK
jgi:branched-chain amino acid transport system permease protein